MPAARKTTKRAEPAEPALKTRPVAARDRRPVTPIDDAITIEINRLREARWPDRSVSKRQLAVLAGYAPHHALRMLREVGPRQSWSVNELLAYAHALGVAPGTILSGIGVEAVGQTLEERILADPGLAPGDRGTLIGLVQTMRRARQIDASD